MGTIRLLQPTAVAGQGVQTPRYVGGLTMRRACRGQRRCPRGRRMGEFCALWSPGLRTGRPPPFIPALEKQLPWSERREVDGIFPGPSLSLSL